MADQLQDIPLEDIWFDDEFNTRLEHVSPGSVASLAESMNANGQLQPIRVQPIANKQLNTKFKCIMGHRRGAAVKLLRRQYPQDPRFKTISSIVHDHVVPEDEALIMNLKENMERKDLNMLQEAMAIQRFKDWDWPIHKVAKALNQTKMWVQVRYSLLSMPREIQERARDRYLNQHQVNLVAQMPTSEEQFAYVRRVVDNKMKGLKIDDDAERQKKLAQKKRRTQIAVYAAGIQRTQADMMMLQESIQDAWGDNKHPAATTLAWAAGIISYDDFVHCIHQWADADGVTYVEHEDILRAEPKSENSSFHVEPPTLN